MQNNMPYRYYFLAFIVIATMYILFHKNLPADNISSFDYQLKQFFSISTGKPGLEPGMTYSEVERIVGKPDNRDRLHVWLWVEKNSDKLYYIDCYTYDEFGEGYFLLFNNGRLVSNVPALLDHDWDSMICFHKKDKNLWIVYWYQMFICFIVHYI